MQLISLGASYMEDTNKNFDTLNTLVENNEIIDVTGMTLAKECALILTKYEMEKGPGRVIGSKALASYNSFKDTYTDKLLIQKKLLANHGNNFGLQLSSNKIYYLILDQNNEIANIKIALFLIAKNYNISFAVENKYIIKMYNYVKTLCNNLIQSEPCDEYYKIKYNSITKYTYSEVEQENKTNLSTEDYILANNFIPTWIFGNKATSHQAVYIKYINLLINDIQNMINNKVIIDRKKGKLSDIIERGNL